MSPKKNTISIILIQSANDWNHTIDNQKLFERSPYVGHDKPYQWIPKKAKTLGFEIFVTSQIRFTNWCYYKRQMVKLAWITNLGSVKLRVKKCVNVNVWLALNDSKIGWFKFDRLFYSHFDILNSISKVTNSPWMFCPKSIKTGLFGKKSIERGIQYKLKYKNDPLN